MSLRQIFLKIVSFKMVFIFILFVFYACNSQDHNEPEKKKEMLIYCGITMIKPILEIAELIEANEDIDIIITKDGSGNLMKSMLYSKTGDLYLPGSDKYYQMLDNDHPGVVLDKVLVGYNKAVIMVQKGNPLGMTGDLNELTKKEFAVVIGNPGSGSIGKETQSILEKKGIYATALKNSMKLSTDSKDLVKLLINKEADIVINWYAVSTWDENKDYMDVIEINPDFAKEKKLVLGLLKYSQNKETARKFMVLASSEKGQAIFKKHGFHFDLEPVYK